jgi:hypothetical protein
MLFEQLMDKDAARKLLERVRSLDDAYFVDRSKFAPNVSLDGSRNKYLSMSDVSMPADVLTTLKDLFPDTEVEEFLVNRYYPGQGIGPHTDSNPAKYVSILFLEEDVQVLEVDMNGEFLPIYDEPGTMLTFSIDTIHKVDPVKEVRHSIIILRDQL